MSGADIGLKRFCAAARRRPAPQLGGGRRPPRLTRVRAATSAERGVRDPPPQSHVYRHYDYSRAGPAAGAGPATPPAEAGPVPALGAGSGRPPGRPGPSRPRQSPVCGHEVGGLRQVPASCGCVFATRTETPASSAGCGAGQPAGRPMENGEPPVSIAADWVTTSTARTAHVTGYPHCTGSWSSKLLQDP